MRGTLLMLALLGFATIAFAPSASAHTTVGTTDGKYLITVGNLNEPITTYMNTGLDLIIRANNTAKSGITGAHLTLTAVLIAPGNQEHTEPLKGQFGKVGSYTFNEPYSLTQEGSYYLRVTGKINDTTVNFAKILVGSGPVPAIQDHTFPDKVENPKVLQDRIAALEAQNAKMKTDMELMMAKSSTTPKGNSPGLDAFMMIGLVLVVGFALRRRTD